MIATETQNITLSLPKEILRKVKHLAVQHDKSVSGLLTEMLVDMVMREDRYEQARIHNMAMLEKGFDFGLGDRLPYTREELHERGK